VTDVAYSPDGQIVASAGTDNQIKFWDAENGDLLMTLAGHTDDVSSIAFSPDGSLLASGAGGWDEPGESTIRLWRVSDGTLLRTLDGHGVWVYSVEFSPDGQFLMSSGRDGNPDPTIKIWRVYDGELQRYYDELAFGIAYAPDGSVFAYVSGNGLVTVARNPLALPDIDIVMTPYDPPIVIPPSGGMFEFNVAITNNEETSRLIYGWIMVTLPGGKEYGPVKGPVSFTLPSGETISRDLTQDVPAGAPPGEYIFTAYCGFYHGEVWDTDSFAVTKLED
jgi:hypothetical protein